MELKVNIIGIGIMGSSVARVLSRNRLVKITAVSDLKDDNLESAKKEFGLEKVYKDFEKMVIEQKPDAIYIATPDWAHYKPVMFCPDVAFTLEPEQPQKVIIEPPLKNIKSHFLIGINISGLLFNGGYTGDNMFKLQFDYKHTISRLISMLLEITESHILLVPHVFSDGVESDLHACLEVQKSLEQLYGGRVHCVTWQYNQNQIKYIIGMCNFFVGSRMHSCIAALSQNIPCACIAYSRKFLGVFDSIGLESFVIDGCSCDEQRVIEKCLDLLNKRDMASNHLMHHMSEIRKQVMVSFDMLMRHAVENDGMDMQKSHISISGTNR